MLLHCCTAPQILGLGKTSTNKTARQSQRPVVLLGPFKHHSNLLPWRESGTEVVPIKDLACSAGSSSSPQAGVIMKHLEAMLRRYSGKQRGVVGAFSAASNVTGLVSNCNAISALLHCYVALAGWDCATAALHMQIECTPPNRSSSCCTR